MSISMSSLCECLFGPVPDPRGCSEERRQADAWHAHQAYDLRHLGRTGRLGFRKLAATSAQLAPLELPLLRHSVVEVSHRHSNPGELQQTQSMPAATRTQLIPPPSRVLCATGEQQPRTGVVARRCTRRRTHCRDEGEELAPQDAARCGGQGTRTACCA